MTVINHKSISGVTSITAPAGSDNLFTVHTNDTTERFRIDASGHQNISGIITAANFKTGTSNLHNTGLNIQDLDVDGHTNLDNVSVVGVTTLTQDPQGFADDSAQPQATFLIKHGTSGSNRRWVGIGASLTGAWLQSSSPGGTGLAAPFWINKGGGDVALGSNGERLFVKHGGTQGVGIGTQQPQTLLDIAKNATNQTVATIPTVRLTNLDTTAVATDIVGSYEFFSKDVHSLNKVTGFMRNIPTDAGVNYDLSFGTIKTSDANAVERLRITSTGNVGIGSDAPTSRLYVNGVSTSDIITARAADTNGASVINILAEGTTGISRIKFSDTAGTDAWISYYHSDRAFAFTTAGTANERLRITSDGKIGINDSNPSAQLVVKAPTDDNPGVMLYRQSTGGDIASIIWETGSGTQAKINYRGAAGASEGMQFYTAGGSSSQLRMVIDHSGDVGIGEASPGSNNEKLTVREDIAAASGKAIISIFNLYQGTANQGNASTGALEFTFKNHNASHNWWGGRVACFNTDNYNQYTYLRFDTASQGNAAEKMRLDSSGNLHLRSATTNRIVLGSSGGSVGALTNNENWIRGSGTMVQLNTAGGDYGFEVLGSQKMKLDSSGNLELRSASQTRITFGSAGGSGNDTAWIRGDADDLMFNVRTGGDFKWEMNGSLVAELTTAKKVQGILVGKREFTLAMSDTTSWNYCFTVHGSSLGSQVEVSINGTRNNTVFNGHFHIIGTHSNPEYLVTSFGATYSAVYMKLVGDNYGNYNAYFKRGGQTGACTANVRVYPRNNEYIDQNEDSGYSGTAFEVTAHSGMRIWSSINSSADLDIEGTLSKGGGSFKIPHPLTSLKDTKNLVHSFIEGPSCDLIYRGTATLSSGSATVNIDNVAGMTAGTFAALNKNVQCFTTNESGWGAVKGSVSGSTLTITAQDGSSTDNVSWMVVGQRQDDVVKSLSMTDDNGDLILEPSIDPIESSPSDSYPSNPNQYDSP